MKRRSIELIGAVAILILVVPVAVAVAAEYSGAFEGADERARRWDGQ